MREAQFLGPAGVVQGRLDQGPAHDLAGFQRFGPGRVLVHHPTQQFLVQAAPVDADAHRFVVAAGQFDDGGELIVAAGTAADVAGIDAQLGQRLGAFGIPAQQAMAVEVEIADQRHLDAAGGQTVADRRHRAGGILGVDGDPHQLGTGPGQGGDLLDGGRDISGVGIGHRLHDDRGIAADRDRADMHRHRAAAGLVDGHAQGVSIA